MDVRVDVIADVKDLVAREHFVFQKRLRQEIPARPEALPQTLEQIERAVQERAKDISLEMRSPEGADKLRALIADEVARWSLDHRRGDPDDLTMAHLLRLLRAGAKLPREARSAPLVRCHHAGLVDLTALQRASEAGRLYWAEQASPLQPLQVLSHRHERNPEPLGQVGHAYAAGVLEEAHDLMLTIAFSTPRHRATSLDGCARCASGP